MSQFGQFDQLQQLMSLTQQKPLDLTDIVDALAQQIRSDSTRTLSEAVTDLRDAGVNPSDYLPVPKTVLRQRAIEQRMQHAQERHELEMQALRTKVEYEAKLARDLSQRGQQRPRPQQPQVQAQAPKPMPPVPQPPAQP